jgi:GNAT superfamily N-acetyltransferase
MVFSITRRKLTKIEIAKLVNDIRFYPNLSYVSPKHFQLLTDPYCISLDGAFAGVCGIHTFDTWVKLGPFVVLHAFQGKGLGKMLFEKILSDTTSKSIYMVSSNPVVHRMLLAHAFRLVPNFFLLPTDVKAFLFHQLIDYLSVSFLKEGIRKKLFLHKGGLNYFVREPKA